ncbi:MAG: hypothetical protein GC168_16840 [Candidatus Hydrogenedens sp.]|nr:hypothetical protein [Candidatus Hydrogenedens sp.]
MKRVWLSALALLVCGAAAAAGNPWVVYEGGDGPGKGKKVVLISGDEEYRSEEGLPQLGKILSQRHGFTCTVLFAINPETGLVDSNYTKNIPGLEALDDADLMIILTRFRDLPDDQMTHIDNYLKSGRPVIGMRTSTHAFNPPADSPWARYANGYAGAEEAWEDGFGRLVLGEKWISHHGRHKEESTVGLIAADAKDSPILRGIQDGDIWGSTDVYGVRLPLPGDCQPLVMGQVTQREGDFDNDDVFYGMRPTDSKAVRGMRNNPMMPVAWTKTYQIPGGETGKVFTTTMGASADLLSEGVRRLLVQAVYWAVGLKDAIPENGADVALVGDYKPSQYGFHDDAHWLERKMTPAEHELAAE